MELEELRRQWQHATIKADSEVDSRQTFRAAARRRADGALGHLARQYRAQAIVSLILPILAPVLVGDFHFPLWLAVLYALYGFGMMVVNFAFSRYLAGLNIIAQPVVTALAISASILRRQRNITLVSLSFAVVLIALLLWHFHSTDNIWLLAGAWTGLVAGSAIGFTKIHRKTILARKIQSELKSAI